MLYSLFLCIKIVGKKMPTQLQDIIIDLIIVIVLLGFIYNGFKRGFIQEFMSFFGLLVCMILAVRYMSDISALFYGALELPHSFVVVISFLIIFIPTMLLFRWAAIKLKLISKFNFTLGSIDKMAGIGLGLAKGAIFVSVTTLVISLTGISKLMPSEIGKSALFLPMKQVMPLMYSVSKVFVWGKYKTFYDEMQETLSADSRAVMDTRSEDYLNDFNKN